MDAARRSTTPNSSAACTHEYNVLALPGSYLGREVAGRNPGSNGIRIALVAPLAECVEAAERMQFARKR